LADQEFEGKQSGACGVSLPLRGKLSVALARQWREIAQQAELLDQRHAVRGKAP